MPYEELNCKHDECLRILSELIVSLRDERAAIIALSTDAIIQQVFRKEALGSTLLQCRREWHTLCVSVSPPPEMIATMQREWSVGWNELMQVCEGNQRFTRHSLRNLGNLVDNLRRLFGDGMLYSAKGAKVESSSVGKMMEATY